MTNTSRIQEELLIIRCMEGDRPAFEAVVGLWQERLYRHAIHLTGDEDAAWDAVQETWIAFAKNIRTLREPAAFGGWIYRILGAKCIDWIRKRQRQRAAENVSIADGKAGEGSCEDRIVFQQALKKLPVMYREILSLRYGMEHDTAEIAQILDIPEGTAKSRLHTARELLRKLLES
jgi:RNA polymerase sigma factor (sigma-70 family)